jgi:surface carbohydrate biosynthesis protein
MLLLKEMLKRMGHKVWIIAGWNNPLYFASLHKIDLFVVCQISEKTTYVYGKFAYENNIRLVINTSEAFTVIGNFHAVLIYNTSEMNDEIIDMQVIPTSDFYDYILSTDVINARNKHKYKFIGYPRFDISNDKHLRRVEDDYFNKKYNLSNYDKKYIFISSFLFESSYDGMAKDDLDAWDISSYKKYQEEHLLFITTILKRFLTEYIGSNDVLLIKKHPWDCSDYFKTMFSEYNCIILDNIEYVVPCLYNVDYVLHTYSTAAAEAWIMDKKTISIQHPHLQKNDYTHMEYDYTAYSYEELTALIDNYPAQTPTMNALAIFGDYNDGNSTYRLAKEIDELGKSSSKYSHTEVASTSDNSFEKVKNKYKSLLKYFLYDKGFLKYDVDKRAKLYSKFHDFLTWENQRPIVNKMYRKTLRKFVDKYNY